MELFSALAVWVGWGERDAAELLRRERVVYIEDLYSGF